MANGTSPLADGGTGRIVISVDAMGSDRGPAAVVAGLVLSAAEFSDIAFLLHGDQAVLEPLVAAQPKLAGRVQIAHADRVVTMQDKPSQVMRHGAGTSMWSCIESVRDGAAQVAVSCGNTGALMAVAMLRLRRLPGIIRPAIASLWPSRNATGFNVMLDMGADIKADAPDLVQFAIMGAAYAQSGLNLPRPRVGLLNVGTEDHKGRAGLKEANELLQTAQPDLAFDYLGFVEGVDIPSARVDVIVTDGFTGNVALKTGEGVAKLIADFLKQEFTAGPLSKVIALIALPVLSRLKRRIDPRRANGGVFLGLNGTVVKSHGSADATGVAAALRLAYKLASSGFQAHIAARVAQSAAKGQDAAEIAGASDMESAPENGTIA